MKNKRVKLAVILAIVAVMYSIITYISAPNAEALDLKESNINLNTVEKITSENRAAQNYVVREHRGYGIYVSGKEDTGIAYESADPNDDGIKSGDIASVVAELSDDDFNAHGWLLSLQHNTSIFCQQAGQALPSYNGRYLKMFHNPTSEDGDEEQFDTNASVVGDSVKDALENWKPFSCDRHIVLEVINFAADGSIANGAVEFSTEDVYERHVERESDYIQYTKTRVEYTYADRDFNIATSYIMAYSMRAFYRNDYAQVANWLEQNGGWAGNKLSDDVKNGGIRLFRAARALEDFAPDKIVTPDLSVTSDGTTINKTGTVIDETNDSLYKIGPIEVAEYTYGWSSDVKEFSGESVIKAPENAELIKGMTPNEIDFYKGLICGIVKAELILDNGTTIELKKDNFEYAPGYTENVPSMSISGNYDVNGTNETTWVSPYSTGNYQYPVPGSKFYVKVKRADCGTATKVKELKFTYRYLTAEGEGYDLNGTFVLLEWTGEISEGSKYTWVNDAENNMTGGKMNCNDYDCPVCEHDDLSYAMRTAWADSEKNWSKTGWAHDYWCSQVNAGTYCERGKSGDHTHCDKGGDNYCGECLGHACRDSTCVRTTHSCSDVNCTKSYDYDYCDELHYYCDNVTREYCSHGHKNGKHSKYGTCLGGKKGGSKVGDFSCNGHHYCYGSNVWDAEGEGIKGAEGEGATCIHGHTTCIQFFWNCTKATTVNSQKLMAVKQAEVKEYKIECLLKEIPLIANVEINKFIYDVNHVNQRTITDYDSTMIKKSLDDSIRKTMTEETKLANPVYAEFGDYVTFVIEIENNSEFGVKVRASDILPPKTVFDKANFSAVINGQTSKEITTIEGLENTVIEIQKKNKASFTVTLLIEADEGTYTNVGKLITRNRTKDPEWKDYVRTIDDDGPIVVVDKSGKEQTKWESRDSYKINDYNLAIEKYVSSYDASVMNENNRIGFTENETSTIGNKFFNNPAGNREDYEDDLRYGMNDTDRFAQPFEAEKTEQVVYSIRLTNETEELGNADDIARGKKQGTQVRPTKVREILDTGLKLIEVKAMIFGSQGEVKNEDVKFTQRDLGNNTYEFEIGNETILDPGDMLIYFVTVEIEENNMFLLNLENSALFTELTNVNHRDHPDDIGDDETKDRYIYKRPGLDTPSIDRNINDDDEITYEYVKQKELIVAGKVFFDDDKDGHLRLEGDEENRFNDLTVNLYRIYDGTETKVGTTKTKVNKLGESGFYTFERVDKANQKLGSTVVNSYYQTGGRYQESSGYYEYYIEFEYDGVSYKATEHYGGRHEDTNPNYGDNNINEAWLPKDGDPYLTDSNAYEFTDVRDEFDEKYETMGYNKAYEEFEKDPSTKKTELTYTKTDHNSMLDVIEAPNDANHPERVMTARSFIKKDIIAVDGEEQSFKDRGVNKSLDNTKTLWLYSQGNDYKLPETEYLKYINLGLVERENVNVSLTKDLYSITTTINGEQITYDYAQNGVKNNEILIKDDKYLTEEEAQGAQGTELNETNGKYIDAENYELELYESDYYYRYEDYEHKAVRDYKTQYSELNIEVTFKITITNEEILQDELSMKDPNREVIVTIDEVADFYDEDFVEYTEDIENAYNSIVMADSSVKYTDIDNDPYDYRELTQAEVDGLPSDKAVTIKVKVPDPQTSTDGLEDPDSTKLIDKKLEVVKAWYYKEGETTPTGLRVSNDSIYNTEVNTSQENIYTSDGYRKLYIRGFGQVELEEGESVDIYVRYIVDKEGAEPAKNILTVGEGDSRKLKITEDIKDRLKDLFGRGTLLNGNEGGGTEGIAEISAYSTWYQNYDTTGEKAVKVEKPANPDDLIVEVTNADGTIEKDIVHRRPAGLVDKNSNPDNLGERSTDVQYGNEKENMQSVDNVKFYEDDTYKTGVTMTVPTTPPPDNPPPDNPPQDDPPDEILRTISGVVWDDSRSTPTDNSGSTEVNTQYSGNGYFNPYKNGMTAEELENVDKKNPYAELNDNVLRNYKNTAIDVKDDEPLEERDIVVRNARVDLIEVVQIGNKYYEEVINTGKYLTSLGETDNTVHQFTTRTDENGEYILYGFKPGYYIVRFGYGDYVEGEGSEQIIEDMTIFNGQDYKSTKYTGALDTDDNDTIIAKLEEENNNDARDDEISRLNTIAYSEIMINRKAEILRGNYDGATDDQTKAMIQELLRNTAMNAETVRFIVKPEKMTEEQMTNYFTVKPNPNLPEQYIYNDLTNMLNNHIDSRDFNIENVNFGIEYRPESQVNLVKEIDNISLVTSDGQEILKLYLDTKVTKDTTGKVINREHTINKTKSIGLDNAQFLTNEYEFTERNQQSLEELLAGQGFVFINIDEEILQGSTVTIQYRFTAENISEIDRIGVNLDELRFKDNNPTAYANTETSTLSEMKTDDEYVGKTYNTRFDFLSKALITDKTYRINSDGEIIGTNNLQPANANLYDTEYTAAGTASNILVHQMYKVDENKDIYRAVFKKAYYSQDAYTGVEKGYYGKYLGDYYYTSTVTANDEIAQIKFDKILDYVDNDLVFKATENNMTNGYWGTTTADELRLGGYLSNYDRSNVFSTFKDETGNDRLGLLDKKGISYDSVKGTDILRTNLAVSVSDRTKDDEYGEADLEIINKSISRFLTPMSYNRVALSHSIATTEETVSGIKENPDPYEGQIMLTVSKMVAQETESEDMTYENIAEIIQFTVTSGRRTNFLTTIGNAKVVDGEWTTSTDEPDTSAAERITFTPPTGLTRTDRVIHDVVEKTSTGLMTIGTIAVAVAAVVILVRFVTVKIKKRRIK